MLIKINAIVREEKFEDVKEALNKIGVNGITVSQVMGCGAQKGFTEVIRGTKVDKNGKEKRSKLFRNLHLQEKLVTGRYSVTK